nr:prolyl oligopeptidase family serine peptidase [Hyphomonas sp. 34-62-18]
MHLLTILLLAAIVSPSLCGKALASGRAGELPPVTVDDVLRVEGVGVADFSSNGRWLAYSLVPPHDQISDYSYFMVANTLSGHQVWIKALDRSGPPRLQPGLDRGATNFLIGFSPDDRRIIVLEHKRGRFRLIACRIGRDHCVRFEVMPDIKDMYLVPSRWNERLVWTSSETFIVPTRDPDLPGSEMRNRPITADFLWRQWNNAWRGQIATGTEVISTGRSRAEEWASGDLVEYNIRTGGERLIAHGRYAGARASPDNTLLAAARVGERQRLSGDDLRERGYLPRPVFDRRYALRLLNLQSRSVQELPSPFNVDPHSFTWSPRGDRLAVFGWEEHETSADGRFYVIDVDTLNVQPVSMEGHILANSRLDPRIPLPLGPARAALLDSGLIVYARPASGENFDWFFFPNTGDAQNLSAGIEAITGEIVHAGETGVTVLSRNGAYRLGIDHPPERIASAGGDVLASLVYAPNPAHSWSPEHLFVGSSLRYPFEPEGAFVVQTREGQRAVIFADFSDGGTDVQTFEIPIEGAATLAASRAANAALMTAKEGASTRLLLVRGDGVTTELAHLNRHLNRVAHPIARRITYTLNDPNGRQPPREVETCLLLPPDFQEGVRYPVVIELYPAVGRGGCRTLDLAAQPYAMRSDLWPARGIIHVRAVVPSDFARTQDGPIAGMDELVDQAINVLVDRGFADPDRLVLYGFSQGGIASLYVATQVDRFAAVISKNGWTDYFSHYFGGRGLLNHFHLGENGGDNRWRYECTGSGHDDLCPYGFDETPFVAPEAYVRNSPVALANRISAPVLLVHSDFDYFDMSQYDEMFGALYRAGVDARYVRYWGEGHGPSSPANIRDLWRRIDAFLEETGVIAARSD